VSQARPGDGGSRREAGIFASLAAITFLCFAPALRNGFVVTWDDGPYIVDNEHIRTLSAELVRWAFLDFHSSYWAPVTWLSFAVDHALWGLDPAGFHLTNNLLHALNAGLFFLVCRRLLQAARDRARPAEAAEAPGPWPAALRFDAAAILAALLFAIHPLRVESVAWATERKDVLSLAFGLLAVLAYLRHARGASGREPPATAPWAFTDSPPYWWAAGLFLLALLSKPTLVALPLALLVLDWCPLGRIGRASLAGVVAEKLPLIVISAGVSAVVMLAHSQAAMPMSESSLASRIFIGIKATVEYLRLTAWPTELSPFYLHPGNVDVASLEYLLPLGALVAVTAACATAARRYPMFLAAWLVYLVMLLPGLASTQVSLTSMADRFTYAPTLSVALCAAASVVALLERVAARRWAVALVAAAVAALLLASAALTVRQISFWKDDVTLWSRAIDLRPRASGRAYFQRATGHMVKGDPQSAAADMNEAIAIALSKHRPNMQDLYLRRAQIRRQAGDLEGAIADYGRAIEADASPMRALYLRERATAYRAQGREDLATRDLDQAAELGGFMPAHAP